MRLSLQADEWPVQEIYSPLPNDTQRKCSQFDRKELYGQERLELSLGWLTELYNLAISSA